MQEIAKQTQIFDQQKKNKEMQEALKSREACNVSKDKLNRAKSEGVKNKLMK